MRTRSLVILIVSVSLASCTKTDPEEYYYPTFKIGDNIEFLYNDFELYDSSTKILYFKAQHPEFVDYKDYSFTFYADTTEIYQGCFWSAYYSYFPQTPFVTSDPLFYYQNYALGFEYLNQNKPDPRNDERLISAFKNSGLLHSGLSVTIKTLSINNTQISLSFVVTNHDKSDLLILDFDKMGTNLFHYYTNGIIFLNKDHPNFIYCNIDPQGPTPLNSWKSEWLTLLKSGDSKQFSINYTIDSPLTAGNYVAYFHFPGLTFQITMDDLFQDNGRIWLGEVIGTKRLTIQ